VHAISSSVIVAVAAAESGRKGTRAHVPRRGATTVGCAVSIAPATAALLTTMRTPGEYTPRARPSARRMRNDSRRRMERAAKQSKAKQSHSLSSASSTCSSCTEIRRIPLLPVRRGQCAMGTPDPDARDTAAARERGQLREGGAADTEGNTAVSTQRQRNAHPMLPRCVVQPRDRRSRSRSVPFWQIRFQAT
jgi:hypothetical protein